MFVLLRANKAGKLGVKRLEVSGLDVVLVGQLGQMGHALLVADNAVHHSVINTIEGHSDEVGKQNLGTVSDRLNKGAEQKVANSFGKTKGKRGQGVGNGSNGVVDLGVGTSNKGNQNVSDSVTVVASQSVGQSVHDLARVLQRSVETVESGDLGLGLCLSGKSSASEGEDGSVEELH